MDSLIIFFVCYAVWADDSLAPDGRNAGMWAMGLNGQLSFRHKNTIEILR